MTNKSGKFTQHECVERGDLDSLTRLLENGWHVDKRDEHGWTPLCNGAWLGHTEIVKVLIRHGADVKVKDHNGLTPLHRGAWHGHSEIVKILINHGADVKAKTKFQQTPLHCSAVSGHKATVKLLIQHGADIDPVDQLGLTPLMMAKFRGHKVIVDFLRQAKPVQAGDDRQTGDTARSLSYSSSKRELSFKSSDGRGQITKVKYEKKEVRGQVTRTITPLIEGRGKLDMVKAKTQRGNQIYEKQELVTKSAPSYLTTSEVDVCSSSGLSAELAKSATLPPKALLSQLPSPSASSTSAANRRNTVTGLVEKLLKVVKGKKKSGEVDGGGCQDQDSFNDSSDLNNRNVFVFTQKTENHYHYCHCNNKQPSYRKEVKVTTETLNVSAGTTTCDEDEYSYWTGEDRKAEGGGRDGQTVDVGMMDDDAIRNCIRETFVKYVVPENIMWLFHKYDEDVLAENDIERIRAKSLAEGRLEGAQLLLNRLPHYKGWFPCLLQVLQDEHVKLGHVAKTMQDKVKSKMRKCKNSTDGKKKTHQAESSC